MKDLIENKTHEIKCAMSALGRRLEEGTASTLVHWVTPGQLACAHRPLRHHPQFGGSGRNLSASAADLVKDWVEEIIVTGIKSVISLMHDRDLNYYSLLNLGEGNLLDFYSQSGLLLAHLPWEDPHHKKTKELQKIEKLLSIRTEALLAYQKLPKPVLVQCSAGIDRSSPVAAYIWSKTIIQK